MKQKILAFKDRFFNAQLDLRVQLFNILAMAGIVLGILSALFCLITDAGIVNILGNLLASAFAFMLLYYSYRTGRYVFCYLITVVVIFLFLFPALFFTAGGYHSGMPSFFILAVIFTAIMLEGKKAYVMCLFELVLYAGICLLAYLRPGTVTRFRTERATVIDIIFGLVVVSVALGLTMFRYIQMYQYNQRQLAEKNESLKALDTMKTEFLSNISHELKTPLTVISSYAQLTGKSLASQPASEGLQRNMRLIESEADRLSLMVSQILDVTRIEEGRLPMRMHPCALAELAQKTLDIYYPAFGKNRNRLVLDAPAEELRVFCDPGRITQVLVNLIGNAVQHTQNGVITVRVAANPPFAAVEVADTGTGMRADQIARLFERYYTSAADEETGTGKNTGTGLGLFICRHIIEEHGGAITVESETGKGTCVRFTLPLL